MPNKIYLTDRKKHYTLIKVEGSETYGLRTYTITITDQDLLFGEEKYKNIDRIDIKEELENVKNIRDIFIENGPRILEKGIDQSIFD
ncbi:MAG: hypothetical protein LBK00_06705 [Treponema sp.]|nr:hypothetical protein [Treponema sp.]